MGLGGNRETECKRRKYVAIGREIEELENRIAISDETQWGINEREEINRNT